jgi:hypothetical protein
MHVEKEDCNDFLREFVMEERERAKVRLVLSSRRKQVLSILYRGTDTQPNAGYVLALSKSLTGRIGVMNYAAA